MPPLASQPNVQPYTALDNLATTQPAFPGTNESRIYFDGAVLKVSLGGAPYVTITTGGGSVTDLQTAYNGGNTITIAGNLPVVIVGTGTAVDLRLDGVSAAGGLEMSSSETLGVSAADEGRMRYNKMTQTFQVSLNGAAFVDLAVGGGASLQTSYAGGNTIVTAGALPVAISSAAADNASLLTLSKAPAGAQTGTVLTVAATPGAAAAMVGASITMGVNATGQGLVVTHSGTAAGSTSIAERLAGNNNSVGLEMTDGRNVTVSAANEGRLIYNSNTQTFQISVNTGAYATIATGVIATSLQLAYNGGASIVVTAGNPVSISNAAAVSSNLLLLTEADVNSNSDVGLTWSRTVAPTGGSVFNGVGISILNAPVGTNNCTESSVLLSVSHAPVAGAGTITDTTGGIRVVLSPLAGAGTTSGLTVVIGANAGAQSKAASFSTAQNAGSTQGIVAVSSSATPTSDTIGLNVDLLSGLTPGSQNVTGLKVQIAATTAIAANFVGAIAIDSRATLANVISCGVKNTAGTIWSIFYSSATALTAATTGILVDLSSSTNAGAFALTGISVNLSTNGVGVRVAGSTTAGGLELASSATLAVSAANEGRLRYSSGTQTFQVSLNGVAYVDLLTSTSSTLQTAYAGGATINLTGAARPVAITNSGAFASSLLTITQAAATATTALTVTATTGLAALFSGGSISCVGAGAQSERFGASASTFSGTDGTAIGRGAQTNAGSGNSSTAVGSGASAPVQEGTAVGASANAASTHCVSVGTFSTSSSDGAVAVGSQAQATGSSGTIAVGFQATAAGQNNTVVGYKSSTSNTNSSALCAFATAVANNSLAIGVGATINNNTHTNSICIGTDATSTAASQCIIGSSPEPIKIFRVVGDTASNLGAVYEFTNASSAAVGAANEGRLRYNSTNQHFEVSGNGVAFAPIGPDLSSAIGSIGGGTQDLNINNGTVFTCTITANETFTFSNPAASGIMTQFSIIMTNGGAGTITWPVSVKWPAGVKPVLTVAGVDVLTFFTIDNGTTWYGSLALTNAS